jgi:hypothetical protein
MKICDGRGCPLKETCQRYSLTGHWSEYMGSAPFNNFLDTCKYFIRVQTKETMARIEPKYVLEELEYELQQKEKFFPGWIAKGSISARTAKHRIDVYKQIVDDLKNGRLVYVNLPEQGSLFTEEAAQ